jgi:hypothetical protein
LTGLGLGRTEGWSQKKADQPSAGKSNRFAVPWSLAKVPVYPLNINKPIREDFRYQSSLPAQLSQNITEFIAVFLIVGIINT